MALPLHNSPHLLNTEGVREQQDPQTKKTQIKAKQMYFYNEDTIGWKNIIKHNPKKP